MTASSNQPQGVDFSKGGYGGDILEESLKHITIRYMPYWWHFREVLRVSQEASDKWQYLDGTPLRDIDQKQLVALSLINHHVYTGIAEALAFFDELRSRIILGNDPLLHFNVRRPWKALYSSLYSSFNALSNIVCVVVGHKSVFGDNPDKVWNHSPSKAISLLEGKGHRDLKDTLVRIHQRLEIRDHLDHYWTIWTSIGPGIFKVDSNFTKGYVALDIENDVNVSNDGIPLAYNHIIDTLEDYNEIYTDVAVTGGFLDQYLAAKNWKIDYSDFGPPHNSSRPIP